MALPLDYTWSTRRPANERQTTVRGPVCNTLQSAALLRRTHRARRQTHQTAHQTRRRVHERLIWSRRAGLARGDLPPPADLWSDRPGPPARRAHSCDPRPPRLPNGTGGGLTRRLPGSESRGNQPARIRGRRHSTSRGRAVYEVQLSSPNRRFSREGGARGDMPRPRPIGPRYEPAAAPPPNMAGNNACRSVPVATFRGRVFWTAPEAETDPARADSSRC